VVEEKLISIKEIAANENVTYLTALRWVQQGKINGLYRGGRWSVEEEEYKRFHKEGNARRAPNDESSGHQDLSV